MVMGEKIVQQQQEEAAVCFLLLWLLWSCWKERDGSCGVTIGHSELQRPKGGSWADREDQWLHIQAAVPLIPSLVKLKLGFIHTLGYLEEAKQSPAKPQADSCRDMKWIPLWVCCPHLLVPIAMNRRAFIHSWPDRLAETGLLGLHVCDQHERPCGMYTAPESCGLIKLRWPLCL